MSVPARPKKLSAQNPAISGCKLGWLSCTCFAAEMGIEKSTLGAKDPTGCAIRTATGDTVGGTTLTQIATVAKNKYGVAVDVRSGSNFATPAQLGTALRDGRGFVLQGNTKALIGTAFRSTATAINHAVWVNEGRGWSGTVPSYPTEVLVYDPAADGRRAGWGTAAAGPDWWPWDVMLRFAAALRPWGDKDPRVLGPGKAYAGLFPDTEPHVHLRLAGVRTAPMPLGLVVDPPGTATSINERSGPTTAASVVRTLPTGTRFTAYQQATGQSIGGSDLWYGDHNGTLWVHSSGVRVA